jgi:hypothetical protein
MKTKLRAAAMSNAGFWVGRILAKGSALRNWQIRQTLSDCLPDCLMVFEPSVKPPESPFSKGIAHF